MSSTNLFFSPHSFSLFVLKQRKKKKKKKKKIHIAKQTLAMADRQNAHTTILCKRVSEFLTSLGHRHTSLVAPHLEELFSFMKHTLSCSSSYSSSSSCDPSLLSLLLKLPSSSSSSSPSSLSLSLSTAESRLQNRLSKSLPPSSLCTPISSLSPETFETVSRTPSLPPSFLPPSPLSTTPFLPHLSLSLSLSLFPENFFD